MRLSLRPLLVRYDSCVRHGVRPLSIRSASVLGSRARAAQAFLFGGYGSSVGYLNDSFVLNTSNGAWRALTQTGTTPSARYDAATWTVGDQARSGGGAQRFCLGLLAEKLLREPCCNRACVLCPSVTP